MQYVNKLMQLFEICNVPKDKIKFEIYLHENSKNDIDKVKFYWSNITNFPKKDFYCVYFKKNKIKTNRKNVGNSYYGLLRIRVKKSSYLIRKISGWINGINKYYWGVV